MCEKANVCRDREPHVKLVWSSFLFQGFATCSSSGRKANVHESLAHCTDAAYAHTTRSFYQFVKQIFKSYTLLSLFGKNIFFSFFALHISNFSFLNHLAISICHSFVLFLLLLLCSISAWATKHYNVAVLKHERSLAWLLLALLNDETHDAQCHSRKKDTH